MERSRLRTSSDTGIEIKVHPRLRDNDRDSTSPLSPARASSDFKLFRSWVPWLVPLFVVANIVIFAVTMYINNCPTQSSSCIGRWLGRWSFQSFKENPLLGPSSSTLVNMGALQVNKVVHKHQMWRMISCIWLHAGVFHLLTNMLSLLLIGIRLEQEFGFARIGFLYAISGFGGSLLSALFIKNGISVGASGALFGLLGGMLSELIMNWTIYGNKLVALFTLLIIIAINLALGILPRVDNFAHIGGFLSGFLLGFVFLIRPQFGWISQRNAPQGAIATSVAKHKAYQYVLWIMSLLLLTAGFTLGLIALFRGTNLNEHCSWCHYLTCVPTSLWKCDSQERYCEMIQLGSQLNMTCQSNGKSSIFQLLESNPAQAHLQQLCTRLCN